MPTTSCPAATSNGTRRTPITPLAPATKMRIGGPYSGLKSLLLTAGGVWVHYVRQPNDQRAYGGSLRREHGAPARRRKPIGDGHVRPTSHGPGGARGAGTEVSVDAVGGPVAQR